MGPSLEFSVRNPPFALAHELYTDQGISSHTTRSLPGYPHVPLLDRARVRDYLTKDLCSPDLDVIADKLWWMSKQDSSSISPLHRQIVKRRTIVVTEDPKLHLVWIHDRIFVKPLPQYLASHAFWLQFVSEGGGARSQQKDIQKAALGFLRTYSYLIQYESDLRIAQDPGLHLIPSNVTWEQYCNFTSTFSLITDRDVSPRFAFGEIRLTRLNFYAPLLLRRSHFQRVEYQYGDYFARFYGPLLFIVGITSVILSALQICVAVGQGQASSSLFNVAFWFSTITIIVFLLVSLALCSTWIWKVSREWRFAIRDRLRLLEEGRID